MKVSMLAAGLTAVLAINSFAATHDGLKYYSTKVKDGIWSGEFKKSKALAVEEGNVFVVMWVNPGCGHCKQLCQSIAASSDFLKWQQTQKYVFNLAVNGLRDADAAKKFATPSIKNYPYCAVYLNPKGTESPVIQENFSGNGLTAAALKKKIKSVIKNYVRIKTKATEGGTVNTLSFQKIGKKVWLKAKAKKGYKFAGWYDKSGKRISKQYAEKKVKVTAAETYTAKFEKIEAE